MGNAKRVRVRQKVQKLRRARTAIVIESIEAGSYERNLFLEAVQQLGKPTKPTKPTKPNLREYEDTDQS